ncbi:hypothetical protein JCM14635_06180 [Megalodesulfovibrio paquesii]
MYAAISLAPWQFPYQVTLFWGIMLDEALHFATFALLAAAVPRQFPSWVDLGLALALLLLLGVSTELAQLFIPTRAFALEDMASNCLGCLAGALPGVVLKLRRRRHAKQQDG